RGPFVKSNLNVSWLITLAVPEFILCALILVLKSFSYQFWR
ncbi:MAG: hypothetical protein ACI97B_000555, partial [Verrucomicrobiales bacterium]